MSEPQIKWRYGTQLRRGGRWIWPRGLWEYDLEKAKACALRTWPHATVVGVEAEPPPPAGARWIHERDRGWRIEQLAPASSSAAMDPEKMWWRDRD